MQKHRRRRAGRPRKDGARRRATTTADRRPITDLGSPELLYRKARAANGSAPVELTDVAAILRAHELIEPRDLVVLRQLAGWLTELARAYGLKATARVGGLWAALLSGQRGGRALPSIDTGRTGGDRAASRLAEVYAHFARLHQLERLSLVMRVASGEAYPETAADLAELRAGLSTIADMQRGRARAPDQVAAE